MRPIYLALLSFQALAVSLHCTPFYTPNSPSCDKNWVRYEGVARDYYYTPDAEDLYHIDFIVTTMANQSEASLLFKRSQIESVGKKIEHIHPLKLLQIIFTDEKLKVGMRNIKKKTLVWPSFRSGLSGSLEEERCIGNMDEEYLYLFCEAVDLDLCSVLPLYQKGAWKEFLDTLIVKIPRKGSSNRYSDM